MNHVKAWSLINRGQKIQILRKRVTLYTTAPYLFQLGTTLDPLQRQYLFGGSLNGFQSVSLVVEYWLDFGWIGIIPNPVQSLDLAGKRLARLKSSLNLKLVQHYKDKKGASKIKGGPHLTQSSEYPVNLGIKACMGYFFFFPTTTLLLVISTTFPWFPFMWLSPRCKVGSLLSDFVYLGNWTHMQLVVSWLLGSVNRENICLNPSKLNSRGEPTSLNIVRMLALSLKT